MGNVVLVQNVCSLKNHKPVCCVELIGSSERLGFTGYIQSVGERKKKNPHTIFLHRRRPKRTGDFSRAAQYISFIYCNCDITKMQNPNGLSATITLFPFFILQKRTLLCLKNTCLSGIFKCNRKNVHVWNAHLWVELILTLLFLTKETIDSDFLHGLVKGPLFFRGNWIIVGLSVAAKCHAVNSRRCKW